MEVVEVLGGRQGGRGEGGGRQLEGSAARFRVRCAPEAGCQADGRVEHTAATVYQGGIIDGHGEASDRGQSRSETPEPATEPVALVDEARLRCHHPVDDFCAKGRSEERRAGKECRSRLAPEH